MTLLSLIARVPAQVVETDTEAFAADGVLTSVVLPLCIVVIMIAMGMSLTGGDFRRVLASPKQVVIGLSGQIVLLPILGFAIAAAFPLEAVFAVSVVLLAASPGGTTSNLIVHAADGDRALSVSLTAISNVFAWITMPILLTLAFGVFDYGADSLELPVAALMLSVAGLTIFPVLIGMSFRRFAPEVCDRLQQPSKIFAAALLAIVVVGIVITNWDAVIDNMAEFAPAFILFNLIALAMGYALATRLGIERKQSSTIAIETGLQNSTLALTIATSVLKDSEMAIIPGLYGIWMLITGFAFAWFVNRNAPGPANPPGRAA